VPKASFTPTEQQQQKIDLAKEAATRRDEADAEYRRLLTELHNEDGVPVAHLAKEFDVERKTLYRHLGRSMT
jgi:transcriptional regulator of acetoin/glycerol metabolism